MLSTILLLGLLAAGLFPAMALAAEPGGWVAAATRSTPVTVAGLAQPAAEAAPVAQPATEAALKPESKAVPRAKATSASKPVKYTVQKGDSVYLIGKKFGVTTASIENANSLAREEIYPGQRLNVPFPATVIDSIRRGDSLYQLAKRIAAGLYHIKTDDSKIQGPGGQLQAPEKGGGNKPPVSAPAASDGGNKPVTSGGGTAPETTPANTGGGTAPETTPANTGGGTPPETTPVTPGEGTIPETTPAAPNQGTTPETSPGTNPVNEGTVKYKVQPGDSLYKIAQKHQVSVAALKAANGLTGDAIDVGQELVIPTSDNRTVTPEVSRKLTLSREDVDLLARTVYAEARGESYEGQVAVAAVILNRLRHPDFPKTIREIIYQPLAFEAVADGQINLTPNDQAYQVVQDALNGWDPTDGALYYWNPDRATSKWIKTRTVTKRIGNHVFGI